MNNHEYMFLKNRIKEIDSIQIINAIFQYLPQFTFQAYLISIRNYKCVITGVSAGLAAFSFLWYMVLHLYYVLKRRHEKRTINNAVIQDLGSNRNIIENLATIQSNNNLMINAAAAANAATSADNRSTASIESSLKNYEKPLYKTNDKNLISNKRPAAKFIEKEQIFNFNKRKPIYRQEEFNLYDLQNQSTEFFEINESATSGFSKMNTSECEKEVEMKLVGQRTGTNKEGVCTPSASSTTCIDQENNNPVSENRGTLLKRKGICSSTEMLHLVDIMNDNIAPDQVDVLAKNLADLSGGEESLNPSSIDYSDLDNSKLMDIFPNHIDEKQLENIDAAIYENQIIFEERIKKNQLTIQNLKLQDEILSNDIDMGKKLSSLSNNTDNLSQNDYENMLLAGINRLDRLKHWRNYLNDLNTNLHDNSTIQHSSFYMLTTTATQSLNSYGDLYINEQPKSSLITATNKPAILNRKVVQWSEKLTQENEYDESISDDLYIHMNSMNSTENNDEEGGSVGVGSISSNSCCGGSANGGGGGTISNNILVDTINKINVDSPMKNLLSKNGSGGSFAHNLSGNSTVVTTDGDNFESFVENI